MTSRRADSRAHCPGRRAREASVSTREYRVSGGGGGVVYSRRGGVERVAGGVGEHGVVGEVARALASPQQPPHHGGAHLVDHVVGHQQDVPLRYNKRTHPHINLCTHFYIDKQKRILQNLQKYSFTFSGKLSNGCLRMLFVFKR